MTPCGVSVTVAVGGWVPVPVGVGVAVSTGVGVTVAVSLAVGGTVSVGVGVGVALATGGARRRRAVGDPGLDHVDVARRQGLHALRHASPLARRRTGELDEQKAVAGIERLDAQQAAARAATTLSGVTPTRSP